MAEIFISYSSQRRAAARHLEQMLVRYGYSVWLDHAIVRRQDHDKHIEHQVRQAKAIVVLWCSLSVDNKAVRSLAGWAGCRGKLIELKIEDCTPPQLAKRAPGINLTEADCSPWDSDFAPLFIEIERLVARPVHPDYEALGKYETCWRADGAIPFAQFPLEAPADQEPLLVLDDQKDGPLKPGDSFKDTGFSPEMIVVPAGSFMMGSLDGKAVDNELPQRQVTIPQPFAVGRFPVMFAQWDAAVDDGAVSYAPDDSGWGRGRRPVINVSWKDIMEQYLPWLNCKTGQNYRLLSEAEWEYCCRAGTVTAYSTGDTITTAQAQFSGSKWASAEHTVEVDRFPPNNFGLYDMHGNVWEWCQDVAPDDFIGNTPVDSSKWQGGEPSMRIARGGAWYVTAQFLCSYSQVGLPHEQRGNGIGFRLAKTI